MASMSRRVYQTSTPRMVANFAIAFRYSRTVASTGGPAGRVIEAAISGSDGETSCQPLHVPLERARQRLVEVVDAEH